MPLVDTNVISELSRLEPNPGVVRWAESVTRISVSVVTVEEIFYGLGWRPNASVRAWFERFLHEQCTILPITDGIARFAGALRGQLRARGETRTQADMLIAATAALNDLTLVTRNVRDFTDCALALLNPFDSV